MIDELRAEAGIRQLHARYADAVFRKDFDAFGNCFTEGAEWILGPHRLHGRRECVAFLEDRIRDSHWVLLKFHTPILQIGEGSTQGRTYVTEQNAYKNAPASHNVATYYERFAEQGGVWRRKWAFFQLHYMGPADLSGTFFSSIDYGPSPAMPTPEA